MKDKHYLMDCIKEAYDKCSNTFCEECKYYSLGAIVCERAFLADYIMQCGFIRLSDRSDENG